MKKFIIAIGIILISLSSFGQAIINRAGPGNTVLDQNLFIGNSFRLPVANDTTAANLLTALDSCGKQFYSRNDAAIWFRGCIDAASRKWIMIQPAGVPAADTFYWKTIGNIQTSNINYLGMVSNNSLRVGTNNTVRLTIPAAGIARTSDAVYKYLLIDTTGEHPLAYGDGGSSSTPTWQETLDAGSNLDKDNLVDAAGFDFQMENASAIHFQSSGVDAYTELVAIGASVSNISYLQVYSDSVQIKPYLGHFEIDTLLNKTQQNTLLGWVETSGANRGEVGYVTLSGLTLSGGVLTNPNPTPGANTALSNLASVAINTSLLPGTDDGAALGSTSKQFSDLFLASGGIINWNNGNTTLTQTSGALTLGGSFYSTGSVAAATMIYGGDKYNTYSGYTGAVFGGISTHGVLDFVDNNNRIGEFYTDASNFNFFTDAGKGIIFYVNNSFTAPAMQFSSAGALRLGYLGAGALTADASGNITSVSDLRLKNVQGQYEIGLNQVMKINPIVYKWKPETKLDSINNYIGFAAQNIEAALGENAIGVNHDGHKSIQDRAILAAAINSIKQLKELNDKQQAEIDNLKKEVRKLKNN